MTTTVIIILFSLLCLTQAEIYFERIRRQALPNDADITLDRMMPDPGGNGGRIGVSYGDESDDISENVSLAGKAQADLGINNLRPFARAPEIEGVATYTNGNNPFDASIGPKSFNQFGFTYERKLKRYVKVLSNLSRERRQIPVNNLALNTAVANSLTIKQVGVPQFKYVVAGAGNSDRDFGAAGSVGTGVKLWENGQQSPGLGLGSSDSLARVNGKTYTEQPQLGAGIGFQDAPLQTTLGAGRDLGKGSSSFGGTLSYKFRRDISKHTVEEDDEDQSLY